MQQGDPIAQTALDIVNNQGLGASANNRLRMSLNTPIPAPGGGMFPPRINRATPALMNQVGVVLMQAHVDSIDELAPGSGVLSPIYIAAYHHEVFASYGLSDSTFGGTPVTGGLWEANFTAGLWYQDPECK